MRQPRTTEAIRADALKLLAKLRITELPVPVEEIAKSLKARVHYSPFDGELAGMLVRREGQIVIGVNSLHHANRQRFTIAHELGHLLYHKGEIHVDRKLQINRRDKTSSLARDPDEIEANRFAAELLMPFDLIMNELRTHDIDIEDDIQIRRLAEKYQVSAQAITHRITNLLDM